MFWRVFGLQKLQCCVFGTSQCTRNVGLFVLPTALHLIMVFINTDMRGQLIADLLLRPSEWQGWSYLSTHVSDQCLWGSWYLGTQTQAFLAGTFCDFKEPVDTCGLPLPLSSCQLDLILTYWKHQPLWPLQESLLGQLFIPPLSTTSKPPTTTCLIRTTTIL